MSVQEPIKLRKFLAFTLFLILALPTALDVSRARVYGDGLTDPEEVYLLDPDTTTKGDWIGVYGTCAYILPNTSQSQQVATGEMTPTSLGQEDIYWRESWSIPGLNETPYDDYIGGRICVHPCGPVVYEVAGPTEGPRALVNCLVGGVPQGYRTGVWRHSDSFTVTLSNVDPGSYLLALYFQDWGRPGPGAGTEQDVTVSTPESSVPATASLEWFHAGVYVKFKVEVGGSQQIDITISKTSGPYAILSGIFLHTTTHSGDPVFDGLDWETKGNWVGNYGGIYYNLAAINCTDPLPTNTAQIPIDPDYDEKTPGSFIGYSFTPGAEVGQYAAADAQALPTYPLIGQYAAYTWFVGPFIDTRVLLYPSENPYCDYPPPSSGDRYQGVWDSGEEKDDLNYFTISLTLPPNWFNLSIYAMDYASKGRSETIEIYDEPMTTQLASVYISAGEINEGIYERFYLYGGRTIIIKVTADPGNLNCFINGIFLDSVALWSSDSMGVKKDVFDIWETVYVTVPATGETVDLYVVEDKDTWNFGDPLIDVSDGVETVTLGTSGYETHQVWGSPLTPGSYDIIEDTNQNEIFDEGDRIDSCNVTTGFFVIPELAMGTLAALLSTLAALTLFKKIGVVVR